jgi:hypothetical protein
MAKKRRRRNAQEPLNIAYQVGMWSPALGKLVETMMTVATTTEVPIGHVKMEASKEAGIPYRLVRLKQMFAPDSYWF